MFLLDSMTFSLIVAQVSYQAFASHFLTSLSPSSISVLFAELHIYNGWRDCVYFV